MNTVQYLNNQVDRRLVQRLFLRFANKYGNLWTSRLGENGDWKSCEDDWLDELSSFTVREAVTAIKKSLVIYTDYPPTQGQLIELCLKESGVPSEEEIINMMVNRRFDHPMVKLVYDRVGSWSLKNGRTEEICAKTKAAYGECLAKFKVEPATQWAQLSAFKKQLSLPPVEHSKVATPVERKGLKKRMEEFQKLAEEGRAKLKDMNPIEFDDKKIREEGEQRADYEKYLLSVPEHLVLGLFPKYAYDRQRLLNMKDNERHLKEVGFVPFSEREQKEKPRSGNNRPTKIYQNWNGD